MQSVFHPELRSFVGPLKMFSFLMRQKWFVRFLLSITKFSKGKKIKGLINEEHYIPSRHGGPDIRVRIFRPQQQSAPLPAMLYCHGGGYMVGCPEEYLPVIEQFIHKRPCIIVAPDYRKSPNAPYPAAFNDCYDTLLWMNENLNQLNIKDRFILAGHSAGGGLTAALTLKARDTGAVKIAFQMPIYPMIDDRQTTASAQLAGVPVWDSRSNALGWRWYLQDLIAQQAEIPAYAAPARNDDYRDFPPKITFVGSAEPFCDETIAYVAALENAQIPVEFKLYEGCFHGFDLVASRAPIGKDALQFTYENYAKYYDKYC